MTPEQAAQTLDHVAAWLRNEHHGGRVALDDAQACEQGAAALRSHDALVAALREYGQHKDNCDAWPSFPSHFTGASHVGKCTCGFTAALALVEQADD